MDKIQTVSIILLTTGAISKSLLENIKLMVNIFKHMQKTVVLAAAQRNYRRFSSCSEYPWVRKLEKPPAERNPSGI